MKKKLAHLSLGLLSLFAVFIPIINPSVVFAATAPLKSNVFNPTILAGPITLCVGAPTTNSGNNNLPTCSNVCDFIVEVEQVIYYMIAVVIWIIVPILVAVGGIMIMLAGANPEMLGRGKKTITGAIWGMIIVLCAWVIIYTFVHAFGGLSKYVGGFGGATTCSVAPASNNTGEGTNPFGQGGDSGGAGATGSW